MLKGKIHTKENYLSIVIIPKKEGRVKNVRLSIPKLSIFITSIVLMITFLFTFSIYSYNENLQLKSDVARLYDLSSQQHDLLANDANVIDNLNKKQQQTEQVALDFDSKYQTVAKNYLLNNTKEMVDISKGVQKEKVVLKDIVDLKSLLDNFKDISVKDDSLNKQMDAIRAGLDGYEKTLAVMWPVNAGITSGFGTRRDPINHSLSFHDGLDLAAQYGEDIKAAGDGTVIFAGRDSIFGKMVLIDHGFNFVTRYGHTSKIDVKVGEKVTKGEIIAQVGNTGRSTGTHLHFGIMMNGVAENPLDYLLNN